MLYTRKDLDQVDTFNILDLGGTAVSTVREASDTYYVYNRDIRGSVTSIAGPDGKSVATYTYDEYGNITSETGDFDNELTYTGQIYDETTGLYYYNARYYDAIGFFLFNHPLCNI